MDDDLRRQWLQLRDRLQAKQLLSGDVASLSLRIPGGAEMWFGAVADAGPSRIARSNQDHAGRAEALHAMVYTLREDAGAIAIGGGEWGQWLADFGGAMPQVFDEQARHIGPMGPAAADLNELARSLHRGGNVLLVQGRPVCVGMTAMRLALNAELFEKCAKAYVLAAASGGPVRALPWLVRLVANRRLHKDARRAVKRFAEGLLPEEAKGY